MATTALVTEKPPSIPDRFEIFDLVIEEAAGEVRARVEGSPAGRCRSVEIDLSNLKTQTENESGTVRGGPRELRRSPGETHDAWRRAGEMLFRAAFVDEIAGRFRASLERAREGGHGLRLRLRLESAASLAELPWEALWDTQTQGFLASEPDMIIVRDLASWEGRRSGPDPTARFGIAALLPRPTGEPALSSEAEWSEIERQLEPLAAFGVTTARIEPPTRLQLGRCFDSEPCQALHVAAHGEPGVPNDGGVVVLQTETGHADRVTGTQLTQAMGGRPPRLVVLNACHSARSRPGDAFDGLAQHLLTQGVAAVVAMRTAIDDAAAVSFAVALYGELALGRTVEQAMIAARRRLIVEHPGAWAIPALYLRVEHLRLFDPAAASRPTLGRWTRFWRMVGPATALLAIAFGWLVWRGAEPSGPSSSEIALPEHLGKPLVPDARCPEVLGVADLHFVWIEADTLELPDRSLTVAKGFCISTTEVSRRDWITVTGDEPARPDWPMTWPMTDITIEDTVSFFAGLGAREKKWLFRLPTPAEWELAGRADATTAFFFGDDVALLDRYGNSKNFLGADERDGPAPVASYIANDWGLHDIHGNVAEWVHDPNAPERVEKGQRLILSVGGSWNHVPRNCRFTDPQAGRWIRVGEGLADTGFRVVAVKVDAGTKKTPDASGASGDR